MSSDAKLSPGVIAAAVTGLLLGASSLLSVVFFFIGIALGAARKTTPAGPLSIVLAFFFVVILLCVGISCLVVSAGLLFRKNWARIGALIWAGTLTALSAGGILIGALAALRPQGSSRATSIVFLGLAAVGILIGVWWLVLFTRRGVAAQFAAPANEAPPPPLPDLPAPAVPVAVDSTQRDPFSILKARWIFLSMLLSFIGTIAVMVFVLVVGTIAAGKSFNPESALLRNSLGVLLYLCLIVSSLLLLRFARVKAAVLVGAAIGWPQLRRFWILPLFLPAVSIAGYFALYWPLSFVMPRFVTWLLFSDESILEIDLQGSAYWLANLLTLVMAVVLAPVVEEFIFRGLLLTRWSLKWGMPRAILVQAVIFGLLHKEFFGHVFFGFVMAVLYIKTKSLLMPILVHAANNMLAWLGALMSAAGTSDSHETLAEFQKDWGVPLILTVVFIPLALRYVYRNFPQKSWTPPYSESSRTANP